VILSCGAAISAVLRFLKVVAQNLHTIVKLNCPSLILLCLPRRAGMSYHAIKEYFLAIMDRYHSSGKIGKTCLLNEVELVTKLSRKHIIRLLHQPREVIQGKKRSGRKPTYEKDRLLPHIEHLWKQMERISGKRMKAALPCWLPFYESDGFTFKDRLSIENMSASTLNRLLNEVRSVRGLSTTTSPSRFMKNQVPINTLDHLVTRPGFTQSDTVAHCGTSAEGPFASTITLTDIDSTWTENRAMLTKKAVEVRRQFREFDQCLPFELLAVNTDSGSEFLNATLVQWMRQANGKKPIAFTRSRPYKKNDNCYVEQKNFTHVRELFGYERIEDASLIPLMNEIYKDYWNPLQNFFLPTFKLKEKVRVGARIVKKYDPPKTPYDRLMSSPHMSIERKEALKSRKEKLNPFKLKADLEERLKIFFEQLRRSKIGRQEIQIEPESKAA
jgi:hypothetical protein